MRKLFVILLLFTSALNAYAATPSIMVKDVQGNASLVKNGQEIEVRAGTEIEEGSILKSDDKSSVDVSIYGNSGFRFLPGTQVAFESTAQEKIKLALQTGNLIARFKTKIAPDAIFEIETPSAVLAVRGTQFWGRVAPAGEKTAASFAVREGVVSVKVKASGETITLKKGEAVDLPENQKQTNLRRAEPAEISAIAQSETIQI